MSGTASLIESQVAAPELAVIDDPLELDRSTRWHVDAAGHRIAETTLQLAGMHCAACAGIVESALMTVPGALGAEVVAASQRATVRWDAQHTRLSALIAAVRRAGYDAVPDAAAPARTMRRREQRAALWRLFVAAFCGMQVMMLATPIYVAEPGDLAPDMHRLLNWGAWVLSLPVMGFAAGPFVRAAGQQLRARTIGMDVPVALGIVVTFVGSMGATFDPGGWFGTEVYYDSLTMFVSFLLAGRFVEMRARHRAAEQLESALARMPESAERLRPDGGGERVSVQRLARGDRVRVALGEAFPGDGALIEGRTQVDEALLTGESAPQPRAVGDEVVAGSINVGAPVVMQIDRTGADTRFEAIVAMMQKALAERPEGTRIADRVARWFLWAVVALAGLAALAWSLIDPSRALEVAVAVLIVTCPCALSLAAPAAWVAAAGGLARRGVVFKRLAAIERLATVDTLFVDKTGTLTEDRPALRAVRRVDGVREGEAELLARAAALAAWSGHPLARALAAAAAQEPSGPAWTAVEEQAGQGLQGADGDGRIWRLGARDWAGGVPVEPPPAADAARVWLGRDGQLLAGFDFEEAVRAGAADAIASLRGAGMRCTLLSGDRADRAQALARRIGLDHVVSQATPEIKLAQVAASQRDGRTVMMVGDGVNDAPVLARADVSFAMGQGALVSRTQADAVIASGRLDALADAHRTARKTVQIVRQNLVWAAAYNAVCVPLALVGWLPPWAAGLGMAGSSLAVVLNAMRAAR